MSRRHRRPARPSLKAGVEPLESRQLMSRGGARLAYPALHAAALDARPDLDAFAYGLAARPGAAAGMGLGGLARALRHEARYAAAHGWGGALAMELAAHPAYAAAHHLTRLIAAPAATVATVAYAGATPSAPAPAAAAAPAGASSQPPTGTASAPAGGGGASKPLLFDPAVAVGQTLDVTVPAGGLSGPNLTYTITPQPLPANVTFNRATGELVFAPDPDQVGSYDFTVRVAAGPLAVTVDVPVAVTRPALPSTEVSGRVVDESGLPLAGLPVSIGGSRATTDPLGRFTLTNVPADPGPLSAGGATGAAQGRQDLTAPADQLLGHPVYAGADNVVPAPLILPKITWSTPASFSRPDPTRVLNLSNPAIPGFDIQLPPGPAGTAAAPATLSLATLSAAVSAQHMPAGLSGGLLLYKATGADLTEPVTLTLPNAQGFAPGAVLDLLTVNLTTGGHDTAGQLVVSPDGKTMTTSGPVTLAPAALPSSGSGTGGGGNSPGDGGPPVFVDCLEVKPRSDQPLSDEECDGCQPPAGKTAAPGDPTAGGAEPALWNDNTQMASDAGLLTGEYFQDHATPSYQSLGQERGVDLQYSSAQAEPEPVAQYQFTLPPAGEASAITSISARVSLAGVVQGAAATYSIPAGGLADGQTYNIPLQVDASQLSTGAYPYAMTVTKYYGTGAQQTALAETVTGTVDVVNAAASAYGAGWSVGGLQQVSQASPGGPALVTAGQQGTEEFDPVYSGGQAYVQDLALATGMSTSQVMPNDGAGGFTAPGAGGGSVIGTAAGDLNGDGRPDQAIATSSSWSVLLGNGAGGFTAGNLYTLPAGYEAKALALGNFTGHANGVLDAAVLLASTAPSGAYAVAVYQGVGDGTFSTPVVSQAGNGSRTDDRADTVAAGDFNGDGLTDLAFTTDDGVADVMLASGGGAMSAAAALTNPAGDPALGVTAADYNGDGKADLVVEVKNVALMEGGLPSSFAGLDLFANNGSGGFAYTSAVQTGAQLDADTLGLVAGDFGGPADGLQVALPVSDGGGGDAYIDVVPLASNGTWGGGVLIPIGLYYGQADPHGDIVAADLNGTGKPSIALVAGYVAGNFDNGGRVVVLLADPQSDQLLPPETLTDSYQNLSGMLAAAPFAGHAATPGYRGPTSDPTTLVHNADGTWTRTFPDGTVLRFDASGRETSETDRDGNATAYAYVPPGQPGADALRTITDPVGLVTTLAYDATGHLSTATDPAGRVTAFVVDGNGNLTRATDPDGAATGYGYSTPSNHLLTTETDPDNATAAAHYSASGLLASETLFDGTSTTSVAAAEGSSLVAAGGGAALSTARQGSVTDPDHHTTTVTFNWMGHPAAETDPTGATTTTTYDRRGFPVAVTDPLVRTTTYTFDNSRNVTSVTRPGGEVETVAYGDPYGVPTSVTDFNAKTTTYTLDAHGDVTRVTYPDSTHEDFTYNSAGRVLTDTDPDGNTTTYTYDADGRLATAVSPGAGSPTVRYGYDAAGDLTTVTDELGDVTTYAYDPMGRLLSTTQATGVAAAPTGTAAAAPTPGDAGFESPALSSGTFQQHPAGSPWAFAGYAGISANGSGYGSIAPAGTQVAYLQGNAAVSQTVAGWQAGTFTVGVAAAQRNLAGNVEGFEVLVDGRAVGSFTPPGTSFASYTSPPFAVAAGTHTITLLGVDVGPGNDTAFVDSVQVAAVAPAGVAVGDAGFESPSVGDGNYQYDPAGTPWAYSGQAGVTAAASGFTAAGGAAVVDGSQVAFLQNSGSLSQSVAGVAAGTYTISFQAAQREYPLNVLDQEQIEVLVDGSPVGTFEPTSYANYASFTTNPFTLAAGAHTVTFQGLDPSGAQYAAFVDAVQVNAAPDPVGDAGFESPSVGDGNYQYDPAGTPWAYSGQAGVTAAASGFTAAGGAAVVDGSQVAFLQNSGSLSQSVAGVAAGTYAVTFAAAQRVYPAGVTDQEQVEVLVDGNPVGTFEPASATAYASFTTNPFTLAAGTHTVTFQGVDPSGAQYAAFVDAVTLAPTTPAVTRNVYDPAGNLLSVTDPDGRVTSYAYDARNRVDAMTDPADQGTGRQTTYRYDPAGNLAGMTDPLGRTTTYTYDGDNRVATAEDPLSGVTTTTYDPAGEVTRVADPDGNATSYAYDADGRVKSETEPATAALPAGTYAFAYDGDDDLKSVTDPLNHVTSYAYDALDRLVAETTYPDGVHPATTAYAYDPAGNLKSVTDPNGNTTTYNYDARNRLVSQTDPSGGGTTTYAYDDASRLAGVTDPDGNATTYAYDPSGRVTAETDPLGHVTRYGYDPAGQLVQVTDRDGRVTQYGDDADGRQVAEAWVNPAGGAPADAFATAYDADGEVVGASDANSNAAMSYDADGRLASTDNAGTPGDPRVILSYGYDADGNRTSLADSAGGLTTYAYDARDQLTGITQRQNGSAPVAPKVVAYAYDNAGDVTALDRYSDLAATAEVVDSAFAYDPADRLTGIADTTSGGGAVASYAYALDPAGRLTREVRTWNGGASTDTLGYSYTNNDQLTAVTHTDTSFTDETFSYDANGNRNSGSYATGAGNELATDGTYDYAYDGEGNLVSKTRISTGDQTVYAYDYRNRLTEVDQVVGGVRSVVAAYTYDAMDRRIGVTEGGATTWTVYDGTAPVLDYNGSGTQTARYLSGPTPAGVDAVLARETPAGGVAWYLTDRLGSVENLVNNGGAVIDHLDYTAFGQVDDETSPGNGDRFKYADMQYDATTQLYFDQARWYDPVSGRFVSIDPIGFIAGDPNLYRYVHNGPPNAVDSTGLYENPFADYWHYLTHPGQMDSDLQTGQQYAAGTAVIAGTLATGGMMGTAMAGTAGGNFVMASGASIGLIRGGETYMNGNGFLPGAVEGTQTGVNISTGILTARAMIPRSCPVGGINCFVADTPVLTDEAMAEGATIPDGLAGIEASDEAQDEETAFRLPAGVICIAVGLAIGIRHAHSAYRRRNRRDVELIDAALEEGLDAMPTRKTKGRGHTWDPGRTPPFKPYIPRPANA